MKLVIAEKTEVRFPIMHKYTAKLIVIQCHGNQKYIRISEKRSSKFMKDALETIVWMKLERVSQ